MRRRITIALILVALVFIVLIPGIYAQTERPSVYCTDTPVYDQIKEAQAPLPWQFWAYVINDDGTITIIDRIRISPTWEKPPQIPPGPPGSGPILVKRWYALSRLPIPLEVLQWEFKGNEPRPEPPQLDDLKWVQVDDEPVKLSPKKDEELHITFGDGEHGAVLVAYQVLNGEREVLGHFLNEAVLEPQPRNKKVSPIAEVRVNFDIHNKTKLEVTNFELDFQGLEFTCADITGAVGFKVGEKTPWGANPQNPLIVRPIEFTLADGTKVNGTDVKWVEPCNPIVFCEWLHVGLSFRLREWIESVDATVQGYWTTIPPTEAKVWCIETENPHGKNVPPAGSTTLPGSKGGQNEDGFYKLYLRYPVPCIKPLPTIYITWKGADATDPKQRFGPFDSGDRVKITEAPGAAPSIKNIGSSTGQAGAVKNHITLPSDPILLAIDHKDTILDKCDKCLVPPLPK